MSNWRYWAVPFTFVVVFIEEMIRLWPDGEGDDDADCD